MTEKNSQLNNPNLSFSSSNLVSDQEKKIQPLLDTTQTNPIFFNTCFDKNHVKELVSWFLNKYGEKRTINFLESLKFLGFNSATKAGISLGIEDLQIPPEKSTLITEAHIATHCIEQQSASGLLTSVEKSQCLIDTWNQTSDLLRHNAIQNFRNKNIVNPVYMMAFSGARGNVSQVRQLVAMRGLMADPQGAILEFPIQSNFREGLTITEYLISCYGARKGLVDTALRTATSGYLTRRLVDSAQHAVISMIDCQTQKTNILEGRNLENRLIGRVLGESLISNSHKTFFKSQIIDSGEAKILAKYYTQIPVRSPLTCESTTSVCQLCYGWDLSSGQLVQIGEAVGVIAAQSIGEPGTQLTMRTFHTGGVGVFSDQALKPIFATYPGKIIFEDSIPGHFIRTPHGKIVYMVKYMPNNPDRVFFKIKPLTTNYRDLIVREQDLPPGSLLFIKNGEIVETKKLIAQASHVKLTKQKLPESSHPVYSPLEGQIFFESMNLLVEKETSIETENFKKKTNDNKKFLIHKSSGLPDTRRMAKIGSFWIFAAYNQHEIHTTKNFVEPGDLISTNTILFNYKFYTHFRNQLQKINSQLTFGLQSIQIPIKTIYYKNQSYQIKLQKLIDGNFSYYKKNRKKALLFWHLNDYFRPAQYSFKYILPLYILNPEKSFEKTFSRQGLIFSVFSSKQNVIANSNKKVFISKLVKNSSLKSFRTTKFQSSNFLVNALNNGPKKQFSLVEPTLGFLEKLPEKGWIVLFTHFSISSSLNREFCATGLVLNNISFPKHNISIRNFREIDLTSLRKITFSQNKLNRTWYTSQSFINTDHQFFNSVNLNSQNFQQTKKGSNLLGSGLIWYSLNKTFQIQKVENPVQNNSLFMTDLAIIEPLCEYSFPSKSQIKKTLTNYYEKLNIKNPNSFIFSKQKVNSVRLIPKIKTQINFASPNQSGWFSFKNLLRLELVSKQTDLFPNISFKYKVLNYNFSRGLSIYQYQTVVFHDLHKFSFKTSFNNWILPLEFFTSGTIKSKTNGEFRAKLEKTTGTFISTLRNTDILTLKTNHTQIPKVGTLIRWGQELYPGYASAHNGQILKKTPNTITLRAGLPILASTHGILHVFQNDLVLKNHLLITLKSRRLQTEDIVQGIPKIEQLFEARESQGGEILSDTVHIRLKNAFLRELEFVNTKHWSNAVEKSFLEAQQFLVENIVDAYANQGVKISEKHVEVIVRQMTSRVRILESGETGLLPGELVQYTWIRKFNKHISEIGLREATYEPIVLGISKSVLQSESFLLAASFQEVSRVLVRNALSKKRDFLRGLHENVIVGQLIQAGTGLITQFTNSN